MACIIPADAPPASPPDEDSQVRPRALDAMKTGQRQEEFVLKIVDIRRVMLRGDLSDKRQVVLLFEKRHQLVEIRKRIGRPGRDGNEHWPLRLSDRRETIRRFEIRIYQRVRLSPLRER